MLLIYNRWYLIPHAAYHQFRAKFGSKCDTTLSCYATLIGQLLQKLVCKWVQLLMDDAITPHYDIINWWHHQPLNSSIFEDKILCEGSVSTLLIQDLVSVNALLSLTCRTVALWMSPFISFLGSALHLMLSYFIRLYSFWGHLDFHDRCLLGSGRHRVKILINWLIDYFAQFFL